MLYNPNWKPETKPDVFSLESLIAWLETMPGDGVYCYNDNGGCMLARYFIEHGFSRISVGGHSVTIDGDWQLLPDSFANIPVEYPRTFGAALARARSALEAQKG